MAAELYAHTPGFLTSLNGKVVILTYHRVVTDREIAEQSIQPGMYVTRDVFAAQMRFLAQHFTVLSFSELLTLWDEERWDAGTRYCVVTFDDGWLDNYLYAFPVLSTSHIPATVFLPTGFIGTSDWFWPEKIAWLAGQSVRRPYAERVHMQIELRNRLGWIGVERDFEGQDGIDALIEFGKRQSQEWITAFTESWAELLGEEWPTDRQIVTWDEVRDMSAAGIVFGSHSVSHRLLPTLSKRKSERKWLSRGRRCPGIPFKQSRSFVIRMVTGLMRWKDVCKQQDIVPRRRRSSAMNRPNL